MSRGRLLFILSTSLIAACGQDAGHDERAQPSSKSASAVPSKAAVLQSKPLLISPEDLRTIGAEAQARGAVITGSVQPERRADLRAEVSAVVLQVLKDSGDPVGKGELLVRLDDTAIRESVASAQESARAAGQAFEQAERQVQRLKTLQGQGMTSIQALEDAEARRNNAQSELAAAKTRLVSARQQLQRTEVRAPFAGIVSDRKVSAGDTAQVGKELVKVIDPASMRFEGLVSADRVHEVQAGKAVSFRVNGYPQANFNGRVRRVDASADPTTRQLEVLVDFVDGNVPRTAGLYAEGRIDSGAAAQVMSVPESSVVRAGDTSYVWRVSGQTLAKVAVKLGLRDERRAEYPVQGGLAAGDVILRNPSSTLADGQKVELASRAASAVSAVSAAAGG